MLFRQNCQVIPFVIIRSLYDNKNRAKNGPYCKIRKIGNQKRLGNVAFQIYFNPAVGEFSAGKLRCLLRRFPARTNTHRCKHRDMNHPVFLSLPPDVPPGTFLAAPAGAYRFHKTGERHFRRRCFDTFDWRLYAAGWKLCRDGSALRLTSLDETHALAAVVSRKTPRFVWEFPEGPLKEKLAPVLEMRALLPVLAGEAWQHLYEVINADQKIVLRGTLDIFQPAGAPAPLLRVLSLTPLRGYEAVPAILTALLSARGGRVDTEPPFVQALAAVGQQPGGYSAKIWVALPPDEPAAGAARKILRQLLDTMQANIPGILADLDTEFLHDFRVAVRRTRSALGQIEGVFSPEVTERFRRDFAAIGLMTNQLRDLDVYLLDADRYRQLLPEALRPHIEPMFAHLAAARKKALRAVKRGLQSPQTSEILQEWERFINAPLAPEAAGPNAAVPVRDFASPRIYRRYRQIVKHGQKITSDTPDEALHALRIRCKKLRYLLEFFASLYPEAEINPLIKQLKKLQDNLGRFNDLSVQCDDLLAMVQHFSCIPQPGLTPAAIGCLVGTLLAEKKQVRRQFQKIFAQFAAGKNHRRFRRLFGG